MDTANDLVEAWIERFGEPPTVVDEELMLPLLAEAENNDGETR
ncbi:hypothetical protein [Brevundimonas sp.]|jgi:hypothetical protein